MKNSTEMLLWLEILTHKSPKLLGGWLLWIFKISQIILHSSINQHKKFITSKYQNTTLINNNCKKFKPIFLCSSRLAIDQEYLGNSLETVEC